MATSTLRLLITAALVLGGVTLINRAFPEEPGSAGSGDQVMPSASPTGSPTPSVSPTPAESAAPDLAGIRTIVLNGTSVSGLAATVSDDLVQRFGVVAAEPGNTETPVNQTTIWYREVDLEDEAQYLALQYFKRISVRVLQLSPDTPGVDPNVDIAVYVGTDFAALS